MARLLHLGILLYIPQYFVHADTVADTILSKENANLFLQTKGRNRRGLAEGLKEECCDETCWYEERNEYVESHGWPAINEALCKLSNKILIKEIAIAEPKIKLFTNVEHYLVVK